MADVVRARGENEVVYLDGALLSPNSTAIDPDIVAVGASIWINDNQVSRLEPGSIPAPLVDSSSAASVSPAGTIFLRHSNSVLVLVSAVDSTLIGTMPSGLNLINYADWSLDDATFVRLTLDQEIEVYRL